MENKFSILGLLLPAVLILLWHFLVKFGVFPSSLVAKPSSVGTAFLELIKDGSLLKHIWSSLFRLALGFAVGSILALILGLFVGTSDLVSKILNPTLSTLGPIPPVAWIPLLIILFGIGDGSKIALIAMGTFFVMYTSIISGIENVQGKWLEIGSLYEKTKVFMIKNVLLPAALSQVFLSARVALALSWILLIAAEVIASSSGLGWLIWDSRNFSRPDDMIVGMIVVGALGKLSDEIMKHLEYKMVPWKHQDRKKIT